MEIAQLKLPQLEMVAIRNINRMLVYHFPVGRRLHVRVKYEGCVILTPLLNWTLVFEWHDMYVAKFTEIKKNNMCYDDIERCAQNIDNILSSLVHK